MGSGLSPPVCAWIFDLDGTLTVPMHDFAEFKRRAGLPLNLDILSGIAQRPSSEHAELHEVVATWEASLVDGAVAAEGAERLLTALDSMPRGVVTRNTKENALRTLKAIGLAGYFEPDDVVGRACAPPKPSADGLNLLLSRWGAEPASAIMVGDHIDDMRAGWAAGTRTAFVGSEPNGAQHVVGSLLELLLLL